MRNLGVHAALTLVCLLRYPPAELEVHAQKLQAQLAQQAERAEAQATTILELQSSSAALEDAAAARAAEAQSLSLQLEEAQEALAHAKHQVGVTHRCRAAQWGP